MNFLSPGRETREVAPERERPRLVLVRQPRQDVQGGRRRLGLLRNPQLTRLNGVVARI